LAQFNGMVLTDRGLELQTKGQLGTAIRFTRIGIGDGHVADNNELRQLLELINETKSLPILEMKVTGQGQVRLTASITNEGEQSGFYFRELGLYANDPDIGEILYCVANAGSTADFVPPDNGKDTVAEVINIITVIGSAANVTAEISALAYLTVTTFNEHASDTNLHMTRNEINTKFSSLENRVSLIESTFPDDFKHNLFTEDLATIDAIELTKGYYNQAQTRLEAA